MVDFGLKVGVLDVDAESRRQRDVRLGQDAEDSLFEFPIQFIEVLGGGSDLAVPVLAPIECAQLRMGKGIRRVEGMRLSGVVVLNLLRQVVEREPFLYTSGTERNRVVESGAILTVTVIVVLNQLALALPVILQQVAQLGNRSVSATDWPTYIPVQSDVSLGFEHC